MPQHDPTDGFDAEALACELADQLEAEVRRRAAEILRERLGLERPEHDARFDERPPSRRDRSGEALKLRDLATRHGASEELLARLGTVRLKLVGARRIEASPDVPGLLGRVAARSVKALRTDAELRRRVLDGDPEPTPEPGAMARPPEPRIQEPQRDGFPGLRAAFLVMASPGPAEERVSAAAGAFERAGHGRTKALILAKVMEVACTEEPPIAEELLAEVGPSRLAAVGSSRLGTSLDPTALLRRAATMDRASLAAAIKAGEFEPPAEHP